MVQSIKTIFLVDDDADEHELFATALLTFNDRIRLVTASNGEEALDKLKARTAPLPDLIFLDLNMPRMNGRQFLGHIRAMPDLDHIPVCIYTTSSNKDDRQQLLHMGAARYITKPSSFDALCETLKRVVSDFSLQTEDKG